MCHLAIVAVFTSVPGGPGPHGSLIKAMAQRAKVGEDVKALVTDGCGIGHH